MILKVDNKAVDHFNNFKLSLKFDSVASTFSFDFDYNPQSQEHKALFRPGGFKSCTLEHNGELLLTGTTLANGSGSSSVPELQTIGGYSKPGILEDCEMPISAYPLQSDGLNLNQIANKICGAVGLKMVVDPAVQKLMSRVFETSTAKENQNLKSYLTSLAAQLNITITHTPKGELWFTKAKTIQEPLLNIDLTSGSIPGTSFALANNWQGMHESITVQKQADAEGGNAGQSTINNPYGAGSRRFRVKSQSSGDDITTGEAARNALSEELRGIKYTITTDRWQVNNKILKPNNIISVIDPVNHLYKKTLWFIESIDLEGTIASTTATINCCLPEVYNNNTPKNIYLS